MVSCVPGTELDSSQMFSHLIFTTLKQSGSLLCVRCYTWKHSIVFYSISWALGTLGKPFVPWTFAFGWFHRPGGKASPTSPREFPVSQSTHHLKPTIYFTYWRICLFLLIEITPPPRPPRPRPPRPWPPRPRPRAGICVCFGHYYTPGAENSVWYIIGVQLTFAEWRNEQMK